LIILIVLLNSSLFVDEPLNIIQTNKPCYDDASDGTILVTIGEVRKWCNKSVQETSNGDTSKQADNANEHPEKAAYKASAGLTILFAGAVCKQKINVPQPASSNQPLITVVDYSNQKITVWDSSNATVGKPSSFDSKTTKVVTVSASSSRQATKVKPKIK